MAVEEESLSFLSSSLKTKPESEACTASAGVFGTSHPGNSKATAEEDNNRCFLSELLSSLKTKPIRNLHNNHWSLLHVHIRLLHRQLNAEEPTTIVRSYCFS
jgi:hypothetical protein